MLIDLKDEERELCNVQTNIVAPWAPVGAKKIKRQVQANLKRHIKGIPKMRRSRSHAL